MGWGWEEIKGWGGVPVNEGNQKEDEGEKGEAKRAFLAENMGVFFCLVKSMATLTVSRWCMRLSSFSGTTWAGVNYKGNSVSLVLIPRVLLLG